jgi:hypothetical protein
VHSHIDDGEELSVYRDRSAATSTDEKGNGAKQVIDCRKAEKGYTDTRRRKWNGKGREREGFKGINRVKRGKERRVTDRDKRKA